MLQPIFSTQMFWCQDCLGGTYFEYQFFFMFFSRYLLWLSVGWSDQQYWYLNLGKVPLTSMLVYSRPFSIKPPVKMKYRLFRSIQKKAPNTRFVLSTGLVNNPLIYCQLCISMLDSYAIGNWRVSVLITPMNIVHASTIIQQQVLMRSMSLRKKSCLCYPM